MVAGCSSFFGRNDKRDSKMIWDSHQTAACPHCGKDSWQSVREAIFAPVQCANCRGWFQYNAGTGGSVKVTIDKKKGKST